MGNMTSNRRQPKGKYNSNDSLTQSSNKNCDGQGFNKHHMDMHHSILESVVNHHLITMQSNKHIQPLAIDMHKTSLDLAMPHHYKVASISKSNYQQSYSCCGSSPSFSCNYSNFNTPPTSYCACCYSPSTYYSQQVPPAFTFSPPTSPYMSQPVQISTPTVKHHAIVQQSTTKTTRLQYTNKDRYILNELFKRTPYPNAIQRDIIARQLGITHEQIRIWFQNRRRLQTQRDTGERLATANEISALQQGKTCIHGNELKTLLDEIAQYKNAPPRLRLNESS